MRSIYGKYTGVRARRVLVLNKSAASLTGRLTPPVTRALPRAGAETSTRPAIRTESNTEKRNRSERGIAANLLGDCRAHSETVIPVFIPYLHIRISVAFRHLPYHVFAYRCDQTLWTLSAKGRELV